MATRRNIQERIVPRAREISEEFLEMLHVFLKDLKHWTRQRQEEGLS